MKSHQDSILAEDSPPAQLLLAIDTCGPTGSVALGRLFRDAVEILGQIELEGRTYSATLVTSVAKLLSQAGINLRDLAAIVAVNGPGGFTGVRVGLSAVKGLAEPTQIAVISVSRLQVLAWKANVGAAALDAHRHEIFLRLTIPGDASRELLASQNDLAAIHAAPAQIAVCDEAASQLLQSAWPASEIIKVSPPTAADAVKLCAPRVIASRFVDLALLDAHYLRRSDAEILGDAARTQPA
jgi:tRNA threonylcarbamoyladenosine biosynthesis protein TsaB